MSRQSNCAASVQRQRKARTTIESRNTSTWFTVQSSSLVGNYEWWVSSTEPVVLFGCSDFPRVSPGHVCVNNSPFLVLFGAGGRVSTTPNWFLSHFPGIGPFLYLLARQCRIKRLSFSTMASVRACS